MLMRTRPLLRAAVVGGTAYYAGKKVAQGRQQEAEQNAQIDQQEQRQFGRDKLDKLPQYCLECVRPTRRARLCQSSLTAFRDGPSLAYGPASRVPVTIW